MAALAALVLGALLAASTPEFRFVDEEDDAKAAKLLEPLLKKYDQPRKCADLLKTLRAKRTFGAEAKDRDTLEFPCSDGKTRSFSWILPSKYTPAKPVGVLFWLHGAISQPAPGGGAGEAGMFRPAVEDLGLIVVGPSTYDRVEWGTTACRGLVRHALAVLKSRFNVDENRVFLAGDSDGGRGAYAMAETEATFYGAVIPVIGSPGGVTRFLNLRNLPWFAINGEKDSIFTLDRVKEMVDGMKASGIPLEWKMVPGAPHDPRLFLQFKAEVQAFLKKNPRVPYPKKVDWCVDPARADPGFPANTFRWIRIEEAGEAKAGSSFEDEGGGLIDPSLPRVSASYEGNRVEVRTRGVKRVTVLVSDQMLDPKKEVEIVVNGKRLFRAKVEPDARAILEEARRFRDRTMVFSNRVTLDVDAEAIPDAPPAEPPVK